MNTKNKIIGIVMLMMFIAIATTATADWTQEQYDNFSSGYTGMEGEGYQNFTEIQITFKNVTYSPLSADLDGSGTDELIAIGNISNESWGIRAYNISGTLLDEIEIAMTPTGSSVITDFDGDGTLEIVVSMGKGATGMIAVYNYTGGQFNFEMNKTWAGTKPHPKTLRAGTWEARNTIMTYDGDGYVRELYRSGDSITLESTKIAVGGNLSNYPILLNFDKDATNDFCFVDRSQVAIYCIDEGDTIWVNLTLSLEDITGLSAGNVNNGNYDFFMTGIYRTASSSPRDSYARMQVIETDGTVLKEKNTFQCSDSGFKICNQVYASQVSTNAHTDSDYCWYWITSDFGGGDTSGQYGMFCFDANGTQIADRFYGQPTTNDFPDNQYLAGLDILDDGKEDFVFASFASKIGIHTTENIIQLNPPNATLNGSQSGTIIITDMDNDNLAEIITYDVNKIYMYVESGNGTPTEENVTNVSVSNELLKFTLLDYDTEIGFPRSYNGFVYQEDNTSNSDNYFWSSSIYFANITLIPDKRYIYRFETFLDIEDYHDFEGYFEYDNVTRNFTVQVHHKGITGVSVKADVHFPDSASLDTYGSWCMQTLGNMSPSNKITNVGGDNVMIIANSTANYTFDCFNANTELITFKTEIILDSSAFVESDRIMEIDVKGATSDIAKFRIEGNEHEGWVSVYNGTAYNIMASLEPQTTTTINARMNTTSGIIYDLRYRNDSTGLYTTYSQNYSFLNGADNITSIHYNPTFIETIQDGIKESMYIVSVYMAQDRDISTLSGFSGLITQTISESVLGNVEYYIEDEIYSQINYTGTTDASGIESLHDLEEGSQYYIELDKSSYLSYRDVFTRSLGVDGFFVYTGNLTGFTVSQSGDWFRVYQEDFAFTTKPEYRGIQPVQSGMETVVHTYGASERWLNFSSGTVGYMIITNTFDGENWDTLQDAKKMRFGFTTILKGSQTAIDDKNEFYVYTADTFGFSAYLYLTVTGQGVSGDEELGHLYTYNPLTLETNEVTTFNPSIPLGVIIEYNLDVPSEQNYDLMISKDGAGYVRMLEGQGFINNDSVSIREISFIRAFNDHPYILLDDIYVEKTLLDENEAFYSEAYGNQTIRGVNPQDLCRVWQYDVTQERWTFDPDRCYPCKVGEDKIWCATKKGIKNFIASLTLWFVKNLLYVIILATLFILISPIIAKMLSKK